MKGRALTALLLLGLPAAAWLGFLWYDEQLIREPWTDDERALIGSLWIENLPPLPADPTNRFADDAEAARLGHRLFFDTRFSLTGAVACSTCHQPEMLFTDGLSVSLGVSRVERNAMSLVGVAWSPWFFWDGRKDSLWSQATAPLEHQLEHGSHRLQIARLIAADPGYLASYESLFGALSDAIRSSGPISGPISGSSEGHSWEAEWQSLSGTDREAVTGVLVNVGKALAAYQRLLRPGPSRFDAYAESILSGAGMNSEGLFDTQERRGLRLFLGKGQCINCHNGPLLTNNAFHNTGSLSAPGQLPSKGRAQGVAQLLNDPFNCQGAFSDDAEGACGELQFMKTGDENIGAHRTPSLRNVSRTAPYMHAGQLATLEAVVDQYDQALEAMVGHNEAKPLDLSRRDRAGLVAFLKTLEGPIDTDPRWLSAPQSTHPR